MAYVSRLLAPGWRSLSWALNGAARFRDSPRTHRAWRRASALGLKTRGLPPTGYVWGECCHVQFLWVHEARRGRGLGARLLAFAEEEAARRGCRQVVLETYTFQAPEFHRTAGYEVIGRVPGHPAPHEHLFLRKRLDPALRELRDRARGAPPRSG